MKRILNMSFITCLRPAILCNGGSTLIGNASKFHSLTGMVSILQPKPGGLYSLVSRSMIRDHFPRPSERKRVTRHGWKKRMSTPEGRRILMNRILKGRWVYSH